MLATKTRVLNYLDCKLAAKLAIDKGLSLPPANDIGMHSTTNNFGFMFGKFDQVVLDFLEQIKSHNSKNFDVLEIGCAYGNVATQALMAGCKGYIASDISEDHLKVFARELIENGKDTFFKNLKLLQGRFPEDINLPVGSVKFGLMNKVLHFFEPKELSSVMERINEITAKGGKWFVLTVSPECKTFEKYSAEYKKKKKLGVAYPGFCPNAGKFSTDHDTSNNLPFSMLFMELADLCKLFESYGFRILKKYSLDLPCAESPDWTSGKDMVGIIAAKIF
jgi:SAM-dependent methyltransferase